MSGLELMKELQIVAPAIKVVVVTCHQDFDYIQDALRLGAIDYIVKTQLEDQNLDEVLARIAKRVRSSSGEAALITQDQPHESDDLCKLGPGLLWVVDDQLYRRLADSLAGGQLQLRSKLAEYLAGWEKYVGEFPLWAEQSHKLEHASPVDWLEDTRKELQKWLRKSAYSEEMIYGIVRSLELIHKSREEDLSQAVICRQVNISKSYFSKAFKDIVGVSFIHYIQQVYMELAKEWLIETNHPVYWIAERCGFSDTRYFSKVFREHTGMLPSEYRSRS